MRRRLACSAILFLCVIARGWGAGAQTPRDFLSANIDATLSPRQDFFQYANGAWLKRNPIPDDQGRWGIANVASEELYDQLRRASEATAATKARRGSVQQLIGDFWFSAMNVRRINEQALKPLRPDFERIDAIRSIGDVIEVVAVLHRRDMLLDGPLGFVGSRTLFSGRVEQDEHDSRRRIFTLSQGGISIGPAAYAATDAQRVKVRSAFREYLVNTFLRLDGARDSTRARTRAAAVFDLEARMAGVSVGRNEDQLMQLAQLARLAPTIDWDRYFRVIGAPGIAAVNVRRPAFYQGLDSILRTTPLEVWRDYLRFCLIRSHAPFLDDATFEEWFALQKAMSGALRPRPRWKRVVWQEKNWLGLLVAQLVGNEYFPATVKARYEAIGESLREAFRNRIVQLDWMSDNTRQHALLKLARLRITIGLPEQVPDFSQMALRRDSYVLNMIRSAEWFHDQKMKRLDRAVDPHDVDLEYNLGGDAAYEVSNNEVTLPSPSAVPGVNNRDLDDAFLYSGPLAHEIAHAFDSRGRHYDADGNNVDWWTPKDAAAFDRQAELLIGEYSEFEPLPGLRVDGRSSLAENLADVVGLRLALDAFKTTKQYRENAAIGGFTPIQRFFLAYAYHGACHEKSTYLATNTGGAYPPCRERVNGAVMNVPEFYEAFDVQPGDGMYRGESARLKLW